VDLVKDPFRNGSLTRSTTTFCFTSHYTTETTCTDILKRRLPFMNRQPVGVLFFFTFTAALFLAQASSTAAENAFSVNLCENGRALQPIRPSNMPSGICYIIWDTFSSFRAGNGRSFLASRT